MATDNLARLKELLEELFQFGSADLDFGIYRVMRRKRPEVRRFLDSGLAQIVDDALSGGVAAQQASLASELGEVAEQIRQNLAADAISEEGELKPALQETNLGRRYEELRTRVGGAVDLEALKGVIFNHVHTFFGRYYEGGDFLSKRRYSRRQRYAVPYNGEEVYLHWANSDQYYVKTAEHFTDYRYTTADGATVRFELVEVDTEQNGAKGERRFFVPRLSDLRFEEARELTVPFEYRPLNEQEAKAYGNQGQQEKIVEQAMEELPRRLAKNATALAIVEPSDILRKHLTRYTRRNTSDYFVHKDLKGFLEQELDFYLKNEVLFVDDLDASGPERAEGWFEVMRAVKSVGREIIAFLGEIENLQRKLFEKRKFVVHAGYCLTLDRVPEELYPEIVRSNEQYEEWERLFAISEIPADLENGGEERSVEWLKANPYLVLDTGFYGEDFKDQLLASIDDLDRRTNGLLISGENFQALNLLKTRYREQVKCIYIDPPYNTGGGDFIYRDRYQHSSWLSMMEDRLRLGRETLTDDGVLFVSIDDHEVDRLRLLMNKIFGAENFIAELVWEKGRKNDAKLFSVGHEYMLVYARSLSTLRERGTVWREPKPGAQEIWEEYIRLRGQHGDDSEAVQKALREWYRRLPNQHPSKALSRYKHVDENGPWRDRDISWPGGDGPRYKVVHPVTKKPCRVPDAGWRFSTPEAMQEQIRLGLVVFREDHTEPPIRKAHLRPIAAELSGESSEPVENGEENPNGDDNEAVAVGMQVMPSVIYKQSQVAVKKLRHILGAKIFNNPKDYEVLSRLIGYCTSPATNDTVMDFFAGSGTTGHAVIDADLVGKASGTAKRKYVLAEMGEYFDKVLKQRMQRVIYAKADEWKDGKPTSRESGISHAFKYMKLESYEDSLNNVVFADGEAGENALELYGDDYLLRYMLDFETRDSDTLLNVEKLASPFDYKLTLHESGETRATQVDLPETFAYLLGMRVATRKVYHDDGRRYIAYRGATAERDDVAVIWRDTSGWGVEELKRDRAFVSESGMIEDAQEVLVNGDSLIPDAKPLDATFKRLMLPEETL